MLGTRWMLNMYDSPEELSNNAYVAEVEALPVADALLSVNTDPELSLTLSSAMKYRDAENMSGKRVMRNLLVMCSAMFFFMFAYQSLSNLQSTMNEGIGTESQAVIYATSMVSCLFLPNLLIKGLGCKRAVVLAMAMGLPYIASNFVPSPQLIMPSSVLMGLIMGPLGACNTFYVSEMARRYHKLCPGETLESIMARFFGILSVFLECTQIFGNLVSYFVLLPAEPILNGTNVSCGVDFVNGGDHNPNMAPPEAEKRYMLVSVYLMSAVVAGVFLGLFSDKLDNDVRPSRGGDRCRSVLDRLLATVRQTVHPHQLLLLPITVLMGMELSFYSADFTQAYIACSWGVHHVGFVTICFGVCGALTALLVGPAVKLVGQMAVLLAAAVANASCCALLFYWRPSPDSVAAYFVFAGVWGAGDAIWWSQVTALYGLMFPNDREAAFSNLYFWSFLGFFLSYSYANYLSIVAKIAILLAFLTSGILGYLIGQFKIRCSARNEYVIIDAEDSSS